jgi:hypothetical protein
MRTQTTNRFLVEDLEDVGRTGELANDRINDELTEPLVRGHEDIFYGYEFAIQGGGEAASRVSPFRRPSASSRTSSAQAPRPWAEQAFPNLIYFNQVDEGNHITAWQEPDIFTTEVRAGFRSLRDGRSSS